jgi:hypothetical protein
VPITRHHTERPQHNSIRKFTTARIAGTAECHCADIPLSPRHSLSTLYRSIRACALDCFARLRPIIASAKRPRDVVGYIGHDAIT